MHSCIIYTLSYKVPEVHHFNTKNGKAVYWLCLLQRLNTILISKYPCPLIQCLSIGSKRLEFGQIQNVPPMYKLYSW